MNVYQFPAVLLFIQSIAVGLTQTQLVDGEVKHEDGVLTQLGEGLPRGC